MHALHHRLATDAAEWTIAAWFAHTLFWLPVIGTPVTLAVQLARPAAQESLIWCQFLGFALASVASLGVALRYLERAEVGAALLWALITVALCIIAGDQVLWGQRISDLYATPELRAIHRYQEISQPHRPVAEWMLLLIGLLGLGGPVMRLSRLNVGSEPMRALPRLPLFLVPTFLFAGVAALCTLLLGWLEDGSLAQPATWPALTLAWALCIAVTVCYRRLTETARQLHAPMSSTI
jgi:hypothetical protein